MSECVTWKCVSVNAYSYVYIYWMFVFLRIDQTLQHIHTYIIIISPPSILDDNEVSTHREFNRPSFALGYGQSLLRKIPVLVTYCSFLYTYMSIHICVYICVHISMRPGAIPDARRGRCR